MVQERYNMGSPISSKSPPSKEKKYVSDYNKSYYQKRKDSLSKKNGDYYHNHKDQCLQRQRKYKRKQYSDNVSYKLRTLVSRAVLYGINKSKNSITKYLPYSFDELKAHLELQFEPWMNWNNHGIYDPKNWNDSDSSTWTWQIDHIIPQSKLPYTSMEDNNFQICWSLNNLRPLSSKQNHIDGVTRGRH